MAPMTGAERVRRHRQKVAAANVARERVQVAEIMLPLAAVAERAVSERCDLTIGERWAVSEVLLGMLWAIIDSPALEVKLRRVPK